MSTTSPFFCLESRSRVFCTSEANIGGIPASSILTNNLPSRNVTCDVLMGQRVPIDGYKSGKISIRRKFRTQFVAQNQLPAVLFARPQQDPCAPQRARSHNDGRGCWMKRGTIL